MSKDHVAYCPDVDNREPEETHVNNDTEENQLGGPQYELSQRSEKYIIERSQEIIEQEMQGFEKKFVKKLITFTVVPRGKLK